MIQRILFEYLVNTFWQVPLLALATWILIRLTRPGLFLQHTLWIAALTLGVLLPLRGLALAAPPQVIALDVVFPTPETASLLASSPPAPAPVVHQPLFTPRIRPLHLADRTISTLLAIYAVTLAFALARLVHGYLATRRLAASAIAHPLTTLEFTLLHACARQLNLPEHRLPELRFVADPHASPMILGIRTPILLLPGSLRHAGNPGFDDRALTAVLAHELAHIRRRDFLANLLARIVALPIAYHPATRMLQGRIRQTREMLCDAHAALAFDAPSTYARSLLSLAATLIRSHTSAQAVGLFDRTHSTLEERIMKLTEPRLPLTLAQRTARIAAGAAVILAATATASTLHLKAAAAPVYAAQSEQAATQQPATQQPATPPTPTSPQAAAPSPAPDAQPAPKHHPALVLGKGGDLTPEQREQLQRELDAALAHTHAQLDHINSPEFRAQVAAGMQSVNSEQFRQQMARMQDELKRYNSPEFRKQISESQRIALDQHFHSPEFRQQMESLKLQFNSPEFRKQMEAASQIRVDPKIRIDLQNLKLQMNSPDFRKQLDEARLLAADATQRNQQVRQQLAEASKAIAEARSHVSDAETQRKLDEAQRKIDQAAKTSGHPTTE